MKHTIVYSAAVALSLGLYGCGDSSEQAPTTETTSPATTATHGHQAHDGEEGLSDMEKMKAVLAKLSPEDAASAEKQHVCPVSGDMLGIMGAPIKVDVNGQQIRICCEGCRDPLLENPDEYLAKLKME